MSEEAPRRDHPLRAVFNGLRWITRTGAQWRMMPHDAPPWYTVYQQTRRWLRAGVFEDLVHDLRVAEGRAAAPAAIILDGREGQPPICPGLLQRREPVAQRSLMTADAVITCYNRLVRRTAKTAGSTVFVPMPLRRTTSVSAAFGRLRT